MTFPLHRRLGAILPFAVSHDEAPRDLLLNGVWIHQPGITFITSVELEKRSFDLITSLTPITPTVECSALVIRTFRSRI